MEHSAIDDRPHARLPGILSSEATPGAASAVPAGGGAPAGVGGTCRTGLRLTRRGRFVLLGLPALVGAAAVMLGAVMLGGAFVNQAQASTGADVGVEAREVTVAPGDTLWRIASQVESAEDTDVLILRIAELNDLEGSTLQPGQRLDVLVGE